MIIEVIKPFKKVSGREMQVGQILQCSRSYSLQLIAEGVARIPKESIVPEVIIEDDLTIGEIKTPEVNSKVNKVNQKKNIKK